MPDSSLPPLAEIALALALAWGAGIRVYAVLFLCGICGRMGWMALPGDLSILAHPLVLTASGFMLVVEFLADKIPWIDSVWDAVHTFIRVPAGAALAAMAFADSAAVIPVAAAIIGGTVAAGSHFAKAGTRGALNMSPEPFSNSSASFTEDAVVPAGLWLAIVYPAVFLVLLAAGAVCAVLLLRWILGGLQALWRRLRSQ